MPTPLPRLYQLNGICLKTLLESKYTPVFTKKNLWKYHFLLTNILHKRRETTLPKGWVVLNVDKLRKTLGNSKQGGKSFQFVDKIREDLYEWKILLSKYTTSTHEGLIRKKALAKIKDEALALGWKQWVPNMYFELPALEKDTTKGVYQQIKKSLKHLRLDAGAAQEFCDNALQTRLKIKSKMEGWKLNQNRCVNAAIHNSWKMAVDALQDAIKTPGNFRVRPEFKDTQEGRAYHIMTSFPKVLRQFVTLGGKKMVEIDISNSQPLLFGLYLKQNYRELTADMEHYIQLVESGTFYSYLKSLLVHYGLKFTQDTFKAEFFAKVFYSREKKFHRWRCLFHMYFPGVSEAILQAKGAKPFEAKGDPYLLTSKLSLLESQIMLQGVANSLYEAKITEFIVIHDAIYCTEEYLDVVVATIYEVYARRGITPHIK